MICTDFQECILVYLNSVKYFSGIFGISVTVWVARQTNPAGWFSRSWELCARGFSAASSDFPLSRFSSLSLSFRCTFRPKSALSFGPIRLLSGLLNTFAAFLVIILLWARCMFDDGGLRPKSRFSDGVENQGEGTRPCQFNSVEIHFRRTESS